MANRLSKEKAGLIASNYCTNGYKKVQALLDCGYATTYANNVGLKLFDNDRVKEAIARIEARNAVNQAMTVEKVQELYMGAHDLALEHNQPSAAVSAITGIARLYGMDKDASQDKQEAPPLTQEEREAFLKTAKQATGPQLKRNTA
jgi:hypothetical protein